LHPIANQRYQQPAALRQDLKALRPNSSGSPSSRTLAADRKAQASLPLEIDSNGLPPLNPPEFNRSSLPPLNPPEFNRSSLPPLNPPEFNWGTPPSPTNPGLGQRTPMAVPPTPREERKSEPRLMPGQQPVSIQQGMLNPASQTLLSSLTFADGMEIEPRNLLPRPEDLPPMRQGNDILRAYLWMGGIILCLLILVLLK
jgi:hypothetical protein